LTAKIPIGLIVRDATSSLNVDACLWNTLIMPVTVYSGL
jgi:hypothetical protein